MGLFDKLSAMFRGTLSQATASASPAAAPAPRASSPEAEFTLKVTVTGPTGPSVPVSPDEVATAMTRYQFVAGNQLPPLKAADRWWDETAHKRRLREGSEKMFSWLTPFVPVELTQALDLKAAKTEWGPLRAEALVKELRSVVRERRKLKQPHEDVLRALYGACVMGDLVEALKFEGNQPHHMAEFVSASELQSVHLDYATMGYQKIDSLGKTDVKWLVDAFGEPAEHQAFIAAWPVIWQNAVSRKCWAELVTQQKASTSLGLPVPTMESWLSELVGRNIGYHKEWRARVDAKLSRGAEAVAGVGAALAAAAQPFMVADLETTGLRAGEHNILEFAALQVAPDGKVQDTFSALVRVAGSLPPEIVLLTGITDEDIAREGLPLADALGAFLAFVGDRPVFFHNAPFDQGFLREATAKAKKQFSNPVHDTLPLARRAWPELDSFRLGVLADHLGVSAPNHRALSDAHAALAVLLAARSKLRPEAHAGG